MRSKIISAKRVICSVVAKYQASIIGEMTLHFLTPGYKVSATPGNIYSEVFFSEIPYSRSTVLIFLCMFLIYSENHLFRKAFFC